jgi:hypothetical protein
MSFMDAYHYRTLPEGLVQGTRRFRPALGLLRLIGVGGSRQRPGICTQLGLRQPDQDTNVPPERVPQPLFTCCFLASHGLNLA